MMSKNQSEFNFYICISMLVVIDLILGIFGCILSDHGHNDAYE